MSAFYILIGVSIPVALGFLIVFIIAARSGQFDDDYTPSIRILMDDDSPDEKETLSEQKQAKTKQV
jgi:cbb3-type cytochrome oxidase maturation protein